LRKTAPALLAILLLTACGSTPPSQTGARPPGNGTPAPARLAVRSLPTLPAGRSGLGAAMVDGTIWVVGGLTAADTSSSTIWAYSPSRGVTGTWNLPFRTHDLSAVAAGGRVYVIGGGAFTSLDTFGSFAVPPRTSGGTTVTFTKAGTTPQPYSDAWAGMWNGAMTIVGGFNDQSASNRVWQYLSGNWKVQSTLPVGVRYAGVAVSGDLYVVGGFDGNNSGLGSQTSGVYAVTSGSGVRRLATLPQPLERAAAAVIGNTLYVFGGYNGSSYSSAILALDTATNSWSTAGHLPEPWAYGAVVQSGSTVYLVGGQNANGPLTTVWEITQSR